MKKFRTSIPLSPVDYEEGKLLLALLNASSKPFAYLRKDLERGLKPFYVYEVKCTDCPRVFKLESSKPISKERLAKGGICADCSDSYK